MTCYLHFHSLYLIHSHFIYSRILQTCRCLAKWMLLIICKILWLNIYYLNYFHFVSLNYKRHLKLIRKQILLYINTLGYDGINLVPSCNWLVPNIFTVAHLRNVVYPKDKFDFTIWQCIKLLKLAKSDFILWQCIKIVNLVLILISVTLWKKCYDFLET